MRRLVYRDYRPGRAGQFASRETFQRSQAQGATCHVHREYVGVPANDIDSVDELYDYEDYGEDEVDEQEYHATGDTGRRT